MPRSGQNRSIYLECRDYNDHLTLWESNGSPHVMIEYLTNKTAIKRANQRIDQLINDHEEWFFSRPEVNASSPLRRNEVHLRATERRLIVSCLTNEGMSAWHVRSWEWTGEKLLLEATPLKGTEPTLLELIPRVSARVIAELVSDSRRARCQTLAQLACRMRHGARIYRMGLSAGIRSGQPGRYARILLELKNESIAVTGIVSEGEVSSVDAFLSSALVWYLRASESSRRPNVRSLWLVAHKDRVETLSQRLALLRDDLRRVITLFEIDDGFQELTPVGLIDMEELFSEKPSRLHRPHSTKPSESAAQIIALAPDAIDVLRARHGETLRYHGLPFARVRRVMNQERVWFGIEKAHRRVLDDRSVSEWDKLLKDLMEHRNATTCDRRNVLYRVAPEAWLESLLRRNISMLDPGLRLAPIHTQFRTSPASSGAARPVDLLALRHDGRLAVIELKVSEDREHVLQGADYWRRVEAHRRCGNIQRARLFDDAEIADEAPLVYLAAPLLSFHRAFYMLANSIARDIKIYRFDLNEDWRAGVRVARRRDVNQSNQ